MVFMDVLKVVKKLRYTIGSQIIKSAFSVILNIAEGSGRVTDKEMSRFFDISTGSINETIAGLDTLLQLGYIEQLIFQTIFQKYESISRQLGGFKKRLTNN